LTIDLAAKSRAKTVKEQKILMQRGRGIKIDGDLNTQDYQEINQDSAEHLQSQDAISRQNAEASQHGKFHPQMPLNQQSHHFLKAEMDAVEGEGSRIASSLQTPANMQAQQRPGNKTASQVQPRTQLVAEGQQAPLNHKIRMFNLEAPEYGNHQKNKMPNHDEYGSFDKRRDDQASKPRPSLENKDLASTMLIDGALIDLGHDQDQKQLPDEQNNLFGCPQTIQKTNPKITKIPTAIQTKPKLDEILQSEQTPTIFDANITADYTQNI